MAKRRIKRLKKLESKYKTRRVVLLLLVVALVGGAVWLIWPRESGGAAGGGQGMEEQSSQSEGGDKLKKDGSSRVEPSSELEAESSSEPETPAPAAPVLHTGDWNLLLVNSTSPLPNDFKVELETITGNYQVDQRIADNVRKMFNQAKEDGITLTICSAYRSPEKQEELFSTQVQRYVDDGKSPEEADAITVSNTARPGTSEHHTGLALDIVTPEYTDLTEGFAETPAFKWLDEHAAEYGFILRYPKDKRSITQIIYEPWHYRYVGVEYAADIKASGLCLEEYIAKLQAEYNAYLEASQAALEPERDEDAAPAE